jgi:type II secretory pathway pseudopilin PulG
MRNNQRGLSLIEATVLLAVISLLTAVLAPSVRSYVQTTQTAAAKHDVEELGEALSRMLVDVGEGFLVRDATEGVLSTATDHFTPDHASTKLVSLLVTDGNTPSVHVPRSAGSPDWDAVMDDGKTERFDYFLMLNTPKGDAGKGYRTAEGMDTTGNFDSVNDSQYNARHAWRGPYLAAPIGSDPWGNRYAANVEYLSRQLGAGPAGNVNDVLVISAGNNGLIETQFDVDGSASANDITYVLSGGTR